MRLYFGGHLAFYGPDRRSWAEVAISGPKPLKDVIAELGIPRGEIAISAVNGEAVDPAEVCVSNEDEVRFYPPTNGG